LKPVAKTNHHIIFHVFPFQKTKNRQTVCTAVDKDNREEITGRERRALFVNTKSECKSNIMPANKRSAKQNNKKKEAQKQKVKKELEKFSSDDEDEEERVVVQPPKKKNVLKQKANASSSSEGSDSEEDDNSNNNKKSDSSKKSTSRTEDSRAKDDDHDDDSNSDDENDDDDDDTAGSAKGKFFTDDNADWLKPKKTKLLDDDDDEEEDGDGEDDDDGDELLEIEREAQLVDEEMEAEKREAEDEMRRTVKEHTEVYHLPTALEIEQDADRVVPPSELRSNIESILEVLAEFKARREPGRSRQEYLDRLCFFLSELYGYLPELMEYFLSMFGPTETLEFVDASDRPRPLVIRTNTLKTRRKDLAAALIKRGVSLDPLANWSKVGLKILESPVPIGATPEYLHGMYMLQSAASMCPVLALAPEPKEKVLDMSAAPGGKTSYMAQLMRNTGVIVANDLKPERQKATVANMHRLGVKNVIACAHDGRKMGSMFKNRFDRILLDAPCSGLGVISRDPSVKVQRSMTDIQQCAHLQKELLLAAIDALKYKGTTGGVLVYSTCSVSIAENEEVVNYALTKRDIRIVDTGLGEFGIPGFTRYQQKRFHPSVALTKRFYPHVHNMDGFFVCRIEKLSDKRPGQDAANDEAEEDAVKADKEQQEEKEKKGKGVKSTKQGDKTSVNGKKRKQPERNEPKPNKNTPVSIPPKITKPKKQQTNAKITKPRRAKPAADI
jgi:25S rRNA (cytosine2870-C5)-methyltransferase